MLLVMSYPVKCTKYMLKCTVQCTHMPTGLMIRKWDIVHRFTEQEIIRQDQASAHCRLESSPVCFQNEVKNIYSDLIFDIYVFFLDSRYTGTMLSPLVLLYIWTINQSLYTFTVCVETGVSLASVEVWRSKHILTNESQAIKSK